MRRLSLVVATHASRDHHGGLVDVLARVPVELLLDGGDGNPDRASGRCSRAAARRHVPRSRRDAPATLRAAGLTNPVLSPARVPRPRARGSEPAGRGGDRQRGDFDLLLSADAESDALLPLDLPDVEAMKVPITEAPTRACRPCSSASAPR